MWPLAQPRRAATQARVGSPAWLLSKGRRVAERLLSCGAWGKSLERLSCASGPGAM